jgi:ABC-2 type transport system permease protein
MNPQARAIVWAQWRTLINFYPRARRGGLLLSALLTAAWYGLWILIGFAAAIAVAESTNRAELYGFLAPGLLLAFLYWQVIPILLASTGASLDMRRLRIYPIPHAQLFGLEVLLRVSISVEMLILISGVVAGMVRNPLLKGWHAAAFVPFIFFNLSVSVGLRDLLTRILGRRRFREVAVLVLVLASMLPQLLVYTGVPEPLKRFFDQAAVILWPWSATARMLLGDWRWIQVVGLLAWTGAAYVFGRRQFERTLRFDEEAARARGPAGSRAPSLTERLFRCPSAILGDPLATMVEKELRSLIRAPRFRVTFLMGFFIGLMIWVSITLGGAGGRGMRENFLAFVFAYSVMLLSEVSVWNVLGFDRSAAQIYWLAPVRASAVLAAKNIAAAVFVFLQLSGITLVCVVFRLPIRPAMVLEAFLVSFLFVMFLMAAGNLSSVHQPRAVDPNQNWKRGSAGRTQALLLLLYPVLAIPFVFAYFARWAWEAEWAFYGVLGVTAMAAAAAYGIALEEASAVAQGQKEWILATLSEGEGPVSA